MNPILIAGLMMVYFVAGIVGVQLDITTDVITAPQIPNTPNSTGGIFDAIKSVLLPFVWVFNVIGSMFQLMTFQADIPAIASAIITFPVVIVGFVSIVRVVRGT